MFLPTPETVEKIESEIVPLALQEGVALTPGNYDHLILPDGQQLDVCLKTMRQLNRDVDRWLERGQQYELIVDFTAGTKCMSAALALHSHRWPCRISYIGGTERSKDGVGVVVSGKEQAVHHANPWELLGYQAVEEYVTLFNEQAYAQAQSLAEKTRDRTDNPVIKSEFSTLATLAAAFECWERFDHKAALNNLSVITKRSNDLRSLFEIPKAEKLLNHVQQLTEQLQSIVSIPPPHRGVILDLLANAERRKRERRFDDGVARLYRSIEAIAQLELHDQHEIQATDNVPFEKLPPSLKQAWNNRAYRGNVRLGLQDVYRLLSELGSPLGAKFRDLKLHDEKKSPLASRNQSILAHGFDLVSSKSFAALRKATMSLSDCSPEDLIEFPRL